MSIRPSLDFKRLGHLDNLLINTIGKPGQLPGAQVLVWRRGDLVLLPLGGSARYRERTADRRKHDLSDLFDDKTDCQCSLVDAVVRRAL